METVMGFSSQNTSFQQDHFQKQYNQATENGFNESYQEFLLVRDFT